MQLELFRLFKFFPIPLNSKSTKYCNMRIDEEVMDYLRRIGPATPLELARKLSSNSLIIAGILVNAANSNQLKKSKRRVGGDRLYYLPEYENAVKERIKSLITPQDKELLQALTNEKVLVETKITPDKAVLLSGLEDLISRFTFQQDGRAIRCWAVPGLLEGEVKTLAEKKLAGDTRPAPAPQVKSPEPAAPKVEAEQKKLDEVKEEPKPEPKTGGKEEAQAKIQPPKVVKEEKKQETPVIPNEVLDEERERIRKEVLAEMKGSFQDNVLHWLEKKEIDVLEEKVIKEGQEVEFEVKVPTPLGRQPYMVRIFDYPKKALAQSDVSAVGMDAVSQRIPAIIISSTGFSKSAMKYWKKEVADIVTLISEEDLE